MDEAILERLAALEDRVREVDAERGILQTMYQYAHTLDHSSDVDKFLDCFVEDAVWYSTLEGAFAGAAGARMSGRAELRAWAEVDADTRGKPGYFTKHLMIEPAITVTGDKATVQSYFAVLHESPNGPMIRSIGRYFDELVRCGDGRWRFKERHLLRECVEEALQKVSAGQNWPDEYAGSETR